MTNLLNNFSEILNNKKVVNIIENGVSTSNKHYINKRISEKWIEAQKNFRIRRTAKALIDTNLYIYLIINW